MSGASTLAPTRHAAEATRPRASRGWVPGAVLVAGFAAAAITVASSKGVDLDALSQIQADGSQVHAVGGMYVPDWLSPQFNPFVLGRFRLLTPIATIIYMLSVAGVGATLVGAIRGAADWPRVVRLLAGFLPGYLMVLGPLQVLFAGVDTTTAAWITLVALPAIAITLHRQTLRSVAHDLRHDGGYRRRWLGVAAAIAGILLLCGLHRLQSGRYFMVPDSITAFLETARQQLAGVFGDHLAQWDQQSDEWVFSAPLMFTSSSGQDYLFPLYAAQFVSMASFSALVFGIAHSFAWRRRLLSASLATAAVMAASPSIDPRHQIALIGGQNPMMWLGHPGRMVGISAPWVALLLLGRATTRRARIAILLATVGLAFTTVSGLAYVLVALAGAGVWELLRGRARIRVDERVRDVVLTALAVVAIAAPLFVYWDLHRTTTPDGLGWLLVAGALAALLAAVLITVLAPRPSGPRPQPLRVAAGAGTWLAALGIGFIFSNNLVSTFANGQVRDALATVLPGYGIPVESRQLIGGVPPGAHFPSFTGQECTVSGHCLSFGYFVADYGVILALALATWFALGRRSTGEDDAARRAVWLVVLSAFVCSFALVDFTGVDILSAWVLTRFIEIPYYALFAIAAVALAGSRSRITAAAGTTVLGAWIVIPLATSHVIPQIARNADWLIARINH